LDSLIGQIIQISSPVVEFLVINSVYSFILACIVLSIKLLYPRLPQSIEYGLWCVVLVRLVLPNNLSFDYAIINLVNPLAQPIAKSQIISFIQDSQFLNLFSDINLAGFSLYNYFFFSWILVVGLVLLRYLNLRLRLVKMLNNSHPVVEYWPVRCANRWRLNFWIKGRVIIIAADKFLSPFTFSYTSPIIFIPRKILETKNEALTESIIAHEMAHIKRRDSLWLVIQNFIQIIYFFNPLVWLIVRQLSSLREKLCDEMVLSANKIKPEEYGKSLLQVLRFNISGDPKSLLLTNFLGHKDQIRKRVAAIASYSFSTNKPFFHTGLIIAFAIFLLPFASDKRAEIKHKELVLKKIDNSPFPDHIKDKIKL